MKINELPNMDCDKNIYGFQIQTLGYAIDLYLSFDYLTKFYINYDKDFKDLAIRLSFIKIGITNLNFDWEELWKLNIMQIIIVKELIL